MDHDKAHDALPGEVVAATDGRGTLFSRCEPWHPDARAAFVMCFRSFALHRTDARGALALGDFFALDRGKKTFSIARRVQLFIGGFTKKEGYGAEEAQ